MSIIAGNTILASDFISTSAGAGDSGRVPKLNASGKLDSSFISPIFNSQQIRALTNSDPCSGMFATSNITGTVFFVGIKCDAGSSNFNIYRIVQDSAGLFTITHSTTLSTGNNTISAAVVGSYLYVTCFIGGSAACRRFLAADLTGVTTITGLGASDYTQCYSPDDTFLYCLTSANTYNKYSISGTTISTSTSITFTGLGSPAMSISNGTYVWFSDNTSGTMTMKKYAVAGGSVITTVSYIINGNIYDFRGSGFMLGGTSHLIMCNTFGSCSPTAKISTLINLEALALF